MSGQHAEHKTTVLVKALIFMARRNERIERSRVNRSGLAEDPREKVRTAPEGRNGTVRVPERSSGAAGPRAASPR